MVRPNNDNGVPMSWITCQLRSVCHILYSPFCCIVDDLHIQAQELTVDVVIIIMPCIQIITKPLRSWLKELSGRGVLSRVSSRTCLSCTSESASNRASTTNSGHRYHRWRQALDKAALAISRSNCTHDCRSYHKMRSWRDAVALNGALRKIASIYPHDVCNQMLNLDLDMMEKKYLQQIEALSHKPRVMECSRAVHEELSIDFPSTNTYRLKMNTIHRITNLKRMVHGKFARLLRMVWLICILNLSNKFKLNQYLCMVIIFSLYVFVEGKSIDSSSCTALEHSITRGLWERVSICWRYFFSIISSHPHPWSRSRLSVCLMLTHRYRKDMFLRSLCLTRPALTTSLQEKPSQPKFYPVAAHLGDDRPLLAAFVTERSWLLFHFLESRAEWLGDDLDTWHDNDDYIHCQLLCLDMEVVNDAAERAVKDVTDTAQLTRDPAHRDTIIVVRSDHCGRVANLRKNNLNNV